MPPQIKNMNELVEYLSGLDERVMCLEDASRERRAVSAGSGKLDEQTIARYVAKSLPMTNIVHPSFLKRAFAIWGHFFVANLIISIPLAIINCYRLWKIIQLVSRNP